MSLAAFELGLEKMTEATEGADGRPSVSLVGRIGWRCLLLWRTLVHGDRYIPIDPLNRRTSWPRCGLLDCIRAAAIPLGGYNLTAVAI